MQLHPVKASEWITFTPEHRELLSRCGAVPVNDVFFEDFHRICPLNLYYGGYGSGKSVHIARKLLNRGRGKTYFKAFYGRKVYDTVRESCFATLVETIEDLKLEHEFQYSKAQTSSMVITHRATGNKFIPFGANDPDSLKSVKDPTVIWCEEFDQFDDASDTKQGDFQILFPRLRTTKAPTEFYASFNTAPVFENHWILKLFFPELYRGDDKAKFDILEGIQVNKIFANYTDNHFIDQADYFLRLKLASGGNESVLNAIAKGDWGVMDNKRPWLYAFDESRHVAATLPVMPSFPVYLSFDFNNEPFACTAWQMSPDKGTRHSFINCIKEFTGCFKIDEMCQRIRSYFPASILYVTGDRSGQNADIGRNQTLYQMIAAYLNIPTKMLDLNSHNLEHADSRVLCNAMLSNYPNIRLSREGCPELIKQCQRAQVDTESSKPSHLLKDRGLHKNDEFDSMRYMFQTYFHKYAKENYFRAISKK